METSIFSTLVLLSFALLALISGGILYLTLAEWRDRRRQDRYNRETRPTRK